MVELDPCPFCGAACAGVNLREMAPFIAEPQRTQRRKFGYAGQCSSCGARGPFIEVPDPFDFDTPPAEGVARVDAAAAGWNGRKN